MNDHDQENDSILQRWRYLPRLCAFLWKLGAKEVMLIAALSVATGLMPLLVLVTLRRLVDSVVNAITGSEALSAATLWLAALLLANLLQEILDSINRWLGAGIQEKLKARAQEELLLKVSRLSLSNFERPDFYDRLHRAQRGLDTRFFTTIENLFPVPAYIVTALSLLVYVGSAHIIFPIILLVGLLPLHVAALRFSQRIYHMQRQHTVPERMMSYLGDLMTSRESASEIRLFSLQSYLVEKRQQLFYRMRDDRLRLSRQQVSSFFRSMLGEQLTYGLVIAGVVAMVASGRLSVGYFAAYLGAAERFRDAVASLLRSARTINNDLRYIRDLLDYLDIEEEEQQTRCTLPAEKMTGFEDGVPIIRFEGVSFKYPGSERLALEEIDFTIGPGEHIALVGENGAGKTTLAKLLLGLYEPTTGRITVNGIDRGQIAHSVWRAQVAAVFQDFVRYELTARENIGFGDLRRLQDGAAIEAAAAKSGVDKVVATLPAAYETVLGKAYDEQGHDLSTGEWQRLALARAYLRNALVLVLDEPTAALDASAEVEVYKRFHDVSGGKSVLFISHRLGSVRLADRILFLDGGRVIEEGTHFELMALSAQYARMYSTQAAWYE